MQVNGIEFDDLCRLRLWCMVIYAGSSCNGA